MTLRVIRTPMSSSDEAGILPASQKLEERRVPCPHREGQRQEAGSERESGGRTPLRWLDQDALDLVQADLVAAPVVELGRAGRGVVGDHRRFLERAPVFQVGRDAGGPS